MPPLLARTWRGATRAADADAYLAYLQATGLTEYAATPGNRGVLALRRLDGERAEWLLVTLWDSLEAVRAFVAAGPDAATTDGAADATVLADAALTGAALTQAVFYPEDDRFLIARDTRATHYDVVHAVLPAGGPDGPRSGGAETRADGGTSP